MQGKDAASANAIRRGVLDEADLDAQEKGLLEFVGKVTTQAYRITENDTQHLRELGWTDGQLAEAVYVAGLFAMFNRVADAFGLEDPLLDGSAES